MADVIPDISILLHGVSNGFWLGRIVTQGDPVPGGQAIEYAFGLHSNMKDEIR